MAQFYSEKRREPTRKVITVTVAELDHFGQGVASYQGKKLFIRNALPSEKVEIRITEEKKNYAYGETLRRLNDSPERIAPRCRHFGRCGGCQFQHVELRQQQEVKARALGRMMALGGAVCQVDEIISGPAWGYRRRARLGLVYQPRSQRLEMGFRQTNDKTLVELKECPVLAPELECLLQPLKRCLSTLKAVKNLGHVELVLADSGPLIVLRHLTPLDTDDRLLLQGFAQQHQVAFFLAPDGENLETLQGPEPRYSIEGLSLGFSPRDFIQVNDAVNQQMVAKAINWLDVGAKDRILDLFCGMGNFTLPLAKHAAEVVGVEGVAALVAKAQNNARVNGLSNVTFFHENLEADITLQPWAQQGFDKILLDPARAGAAGVLAHIVNLSPKKVVYVSCNHATLARDSETFLRAGYQIVSIAMLDMFPQTGHLESIVLFERK